MKAHQFAYEQTIATPVETSGIGLHSGAPVKLRILPATAGTGIVFRRTDLDGFSVEALGRNVAKVSYATSLMKKGVLISTTEHVLAALIGCGIDNAVVELDNLEVPILDGSALPFVAMIDQAGVKRQRRKRKYLRILDRVEVRDGDKCISVEPYDCYAVNYAINFNHPLIGHSSFEVNLTNGGFGREIAPARTFGFFHEAEVLKNMGLIRGASPDNAVVLSKTDVMNGALRYPDEFVRHKILDLIGDLALLGRRMVGRVAADRAGHAMHTALVSKILRTPSVWEEVTVDELMPTAAEKATVTAVAFAD